MPASPHPFVDTQPDGTEVRLRIRGGEAKHWIEDGNGFAVVRSRGRFVYARTDAAGRLVPSDLLVGRDDPRVAGLRPHRPNGPAHRKRPAGPALAPGAFSSSSSAPPEAALATQGTLRNLVVLLRFADHAGRVLPSRDSVDVLFNAEGGDPVLAPTGSVRDLFLENSYGQLEIDSTVIAWVDLPHTEQYYANGNSGLTTRLHQALVHALGVLEADPAFDFRSFDQDGDGRIDAITFLHSGYGAEWGGTDAGGAYYTDRIWSHKWAIFPAWTSGDGVTVYDYHISPALWSTSGSAIGRIGVISHELGHFLGLPDLYDTDFSGEGIGSFGLMANAWGFDGSQLYPPHLSPWSKAALGWVTPMPLTPGAHVLPAAETSPSVYRLDLGYPSGEYLLVENRQPLGFDARIPQGGLAVWHIDESGALDGEGYPGQSGWPENGLHYAVALLQADGRYDLEKGRNRGDAGDLFRAGGAGALGPTTVPGTHAYQLGFAGLTGNRLFAIGSSGPTMSFAFEVAEPACENGLDDDGDGALDFPDDTDCRAPDDLSEAADCSDGMDGDGDGLVDAEDPGCPFPVGKLENPACDDREDNDRDGLVDFDDPNCSRAWPYHEDDARCGLGFELALALPLLRRRRGRRTRRI